MSFKEFFGVVSEVLKHWQIWVTLVAMMFVMWFANFIVKYNKKTRQKRPVKKAAPKPKPKPAPVAEEDDAENE